MQVGDRVRLKVDIYEPADDYSPGGYLAFEGEILIVRAVYGDGHNFPFSISHENVTNNSFAVKADEVELIED